MPDLEPLKIKLCFLDVVEFKENLTLAVDNYYTQQQAVTLLLSRNITVSQLVHYLSTTQTSFYPEVNMVPNKMVVMLVNNSHELSAKEVIFELTAENKGSSGISSLGLVDQSANQAQKKKLSEDFGVESYSELIVVSNMLQMTKIDYSTQERIQKMSELYYFLGKIYGFDGKQIYQM